MPRFSANLSMLYTEHDFLDRFAAAASDGFQGVEYLAPYDYPENIIASALDKAGVQQVVFNLPFGDGAAGERGIAALPGRESEFRDGVDRALSYARVLKCSKLNCLAGIVTDKAGQEEALAVLSENLGYAAPRLEEAGIQLLVEPINNFDMPGFVLNTTAETLSLFDRLGHNNLWLQYDIYHMQRMQGELVATFAAHHDRIAHVQIADTPGRHEPGTGEINFPFIFKELDRLNYNGWVGCEYLPAKGTRSGLGWRDALTGDTA